MKRAIVVGGGIGGLATAIGLRRIGWNVQVLEQAPVLHEVGAGITIWTNGLAALKRLGIDSQLRQFGTTTATSGIFTSDGERLFSLSDNSFLTLHRAQLHQVLIDTLGIEHVQVSARVTRVIQNEEQATAYLADGTAVHGNVLIAADGVHSVVGESLFRDGPSRYSGYTAWRSVIDYPFHNLPVGEIWGRGARFGILPLTDGRIYWFAMQDAPADGRSPDSERAELLRTFGNWKSVSDLIAATPESSILRGDIVDRPPRRTWTQGRVALLGDAAHAMTPNLGQGACQALEDAVVLTHCLRENSSILSALHTYERNRKRRANAYVRQSWQVGVVAQWRHPIPVYVRTMAVKYIMPYSQKIVLGIMRRHNLPQILT